MERMFRRSFLRLSVILATVGLVLVLTSAGLRAQDDSKWTRKYKTPPASSRIEVTILKDVNGKPIDNASVIFHPIEGDRDKGALELKTNEDGKAIIDVIPVGDTVRLQVIANGFQTYGQDYKVDKSEMTMEIRMKRPGSQYSIYKNGSANANSGSGSDSKSSPPPAQDNKGSGSSSSTPPSQNQDQTQSK